MTFRARVIELPDGSRIVLRSAEPEDTEAMLRFRREEVAPSPFVLTVPDEVPNDPAEQAASLQKHRDQTNSIMLLAFAGDELIGVSNLVGAERAKIRHNAYFGTTVATAWRNRGVGRAMLDALIAWAHASPEVLRLTLDVLAENTRARRMYELAGFRECGFERRAIRQPDGTFLDNVRMEMWVG